MTEIKLVSLLAPNYDFFYRGLAQHLRLRTGIAVHYVDHPEWLAKKEMFLRGDADVGFVCGLQYVDWKDSGRAALELLAAPVMRGSRYGGRPEYFSDVIVRRDSSARSFSDLRGCSWAYNEPSSHSGCNLGWFHLAEIGEDATYFNRLVESGAHQSSIEFVLNGIVDAAAIDSIVLDMELMNRPELMSEIRVIETLGPSPIPPAATHGNVPARAKDELRMALHEMHFEGAGVNLLARALIDRFVPVVDSDYDPIRRMAAAAGRVRSRIPVFTEITE